jgi:hypothetical protein
LVRSIALGRGDGRRGLAKDVIGGIEAEKIALLAGVAALFSGSDFAEGRAAFLARCAPEF